MILNYKEQYEKLIANGFDKYPNRRDLSILAHKWKQEGNDIETINKKLVDFCKKFSNVSISVCETYIKEVIEKLDTYLRTLKEKIEFTQKELEVIKAYKNSDIEKVLFILMCYYKINNKFYLCANSNISIKEIFEIAKVKATKEKQLSILHELYTNGEMHITLKPLLSVSVIQYPQSEKVLEVPVGYDMVSYYLLFTKEYIRCKNCGCIIKKTSNNIKYCNKCRKTIKHNQQIDSMRKKRNVEKLKLQKN